MQRFFDIAKHLDFMYEAIWVSYVFMRHTLEDADCAKLACALDAFDFSVATKAADFDPMRHRIVLVRGDKEQLQAVEALPLELGREPLVISVEHVEFSGQ